MGYWFSVFPPTNNNVINQWLSNNELASFDINSVVSEDSIILFVDSGIWRTLMGAETITSRWFQCFLKMAFIWTFSWNILTNLILKYEVNTDTWPFCQLHTSHSSAPASTSLKSFWDFLELQLLIHVSWAWILVGFGYLRLNLCLFVCCWFVTYTVLSVLIIILKGGIMENETGKK